MNLMSEQKAHAIAVAKDKIKKNTPGDMTVFECDVYHDYVSSLETFVKSFYDWKDNTSQPYLIFLNPNEGERQ